MASEIRTEDDLQQFVANIVLESATRFTERDYKALVLRVKEATGLPKEKVRAVALQVIKALAGEMGPKGKALQKYLQKKGEAVEESTGAANMGAHMQLGSAFMQRPLSVMPYNQ